MILVIDANILFSALIKNSTTADLIFDKALELYACEFMIDEFFKYEDMITRKTHRTREEFVMTMHQLNDIITVIPQEEYLQFMRRAGVITPDEKDTAYIALALKLGCGIWSNDKELKKQDAAKVYNSEEILKQK
jgi:predicted nucleic acid-binding protein